MTKAKKRPKAGTSKAEAAQSENRQKTHRPKRAAPKTAFKPGQSGNPGGRPKLTPELIELRELARQHTREAVEAIISVMTDDTAPASARVSAASELLDRGWGRAPAVVEGNVKHDHEHHHSHESVSGTAAWIAELLGAGSDSKAAKPLPH